MKILRGGSAEVKSNQWKKFDIELDESDLQALTIKHNIDYSQLTVVQKYRLLSKQAEILVTVEMETAGVLGEKSSGALTAEFKDFINSLPRTV